jgi:hypothetical protein
MLAHLDAVEFRLLAGDKARMLKLPYLDRQRSLKQSRQALTLSLIVPVSSSTCFICWVSVDHHGWKDSLPLKIHTC